jgi:hypothetical protein
MTLTPLHQVSRTKTLYYKRGQIGHFCLKHKTVPFAGEGFLCLRTKTSIRVWLSAKPTGSGTRINQRRVRQAKKRVSKTRTLPCVSVSVLCALPVLRFSCRLRADSHYPVSCCATAQKTFASEGDFFKSPTSAECKTSNLYPFPV